MSLVSSPQKVLWRIRTVVSILLAAAAVSMYFTGDILSRYIRESRMQQIHSAHYEILFPERASTPETMMQFASQRETLFTTIEKNLGNAAPDARIRIVFDTVFLHSGKVRGGQEHPYSVSGTTIRALLPPRGPALPAVADAEVLLNSAWGKPGNSEIAGWTAIWLTGDWRGDEIGMAAASVEQKLGHQKLTSLLSDPPSAIFTADDDDLLGAAWISETAEFGGTDAVRKLYAAKMSKLSVAEAAKALDLPPPELERKWQLWMYAYLAGMPAMQQGSGMPMKMPMDMPMAGSH